MAHIRSFKPVAAIAIVLIGLIVGDALLEIKQSKESQLNLKRVRAATEKWCEKENESREEMNVRYDATKDGFTLNAEMVQAVSYLSESREVKELLSQKAAQLMELTDDIRPLPILDCQKVVDQVIHQVAAFIPRSLNGP